MTQVLEFVGIVVDTDLDGDGVLDAFSVEFSLSFVSVNWYIQTCQELRSDAETSAVTAPSISAIPSTCWDTLYRWRRAGLYGQQ